MPTATTTVSMSAQFPLKASLNSHLSSASLSTHSPTSPTAKSSTSATLRSLYNRAGRAFVQRDISLTYSLIQSAFTLLSPPGSIPDALADHRRKWDILRITFESTVYTSPPASTDTLPESLRAVLSEPAQALVTSVYKRSLSLFTPSNGNPTQKVALNAAYLPSQVLITLVYSSLKVDAADVGRVMIEEWLASRQRQYTLDAQEESEGEGYAKILDLYCIRILPKLEQWDYAEEFLEYENEMPERKREHLKKTLHDLHAQAMASNRPAEALVTSGPSSPRSYSPAPSTSSSSSSLSTTSTSTIVPTTGRGNRLAALTNFSQTTPSSSSSTSIASDDTTTPQTVRATMPPAANGTHISPRQRSKSRTASSSASSVYAGLPRMQLAHQTSATATPPSILALIRASLKPYLTRTRVTTFLVLFVLVPLISFVLRMRRRRLLLTTGAATSAAAASASTADIVRRRLGAAPASESGVVRRAWDEAVRVVGDTVKMAGSGLV
ncbi:hypothetical protein BDN70DRAFT_993336 [Pholiota conissans]|uniref:Uncharacterized protein n=1 Tax=Pholiota conissans TaxID=109636 RepID=A0A9P5Z2G2_9AGAR|nr:hypothetical protein BDN70DRAFT_993336 [Pholiota conissans]